MKTFSWLHFSDIHWGQEGQEGRWPTIREELQKKIQEVNQKTGPFHIVFFTGDIAHKGDTDEFNNFRQKFIIPLWKFFKTDLRCDPRLIPIPGNHDILRPTKMTSQYIALARWNEQDEISKDFWKNPESEYKDAINKLFSNYMIWLRSVEKYLPEARYGYMPGDISASIDVDNIKIGVVGLNSAYLHFDKGNFQNKLDLSIHQINNVCDNDIPRWCKKHHINFLLTHHPHNWLSKNALQDFKAEIATPENFFAHIFGHMHDEQVISNEVGGSLPVRTWQSYSLFGLEKYDTDGQSKIERRHGFCAGKIEFSEDISKYYLYPYKAEITQAGQWEFHPDYQLGGLDTNQAICKSFPLSEEIRCLLHKEKELIPTEKKISSTSSDEKTKDSHLQEGQSSSFSTDKNGAMRYSQIWQSYSDTINNFLKPLGKNIEKISSKFNNNHFIVVTGDAGVGKSVLSRQFFQRDSAIYKLWLPLGDILTDANNTLEKALQLDSDFYSSFPAGEGENNSALLIFDGLDEISGNSISIQNVFVNIANFVRTNIRILLTCRSFEWENNRELARFKTLKYDIYSLERWASSDVVEYFQQLHMDQSILGDSKFADLLKVPFNLQIYSHIYCTLAKNGKPFIPQTQIELLRKYWAIRVKNYSSSLEKAALCCFAHRRLNFRSQEIDAAGEDWEFLCRNDILSKRFDFYAFKHALLSEFALVLGQNWLTDIPCFFAFLKEPFEAAWLGSLKLTFQYYAAEATNDENAFLNLATVILGDNQCSHWAPLYLHSIATMSAEPTRITLLSKIFSQKKIYEKWAQRFLESLNKNDPGWLMLLQNWGNFCFHIHDAKFHEYYCSLIEYYATNFSIKEDEKKSLITLLKSVAERVIQEDGLAILWYIRRYVDCIGAFQNGSTIDWILEKARQSVKISNMPTDVASKHIRWISAINALKATELLESFFIHPDDEQQLLGNYSGSWSMIRSNIPLEIFLNDPVPYLQTLMKLANIDILHDLKQKDPEILAHSETILEDLSCVWYFGGRKKYRLGFKDSLIGVIQKIFEHHIKKYDEKDNAPLFDCLKKSRFSVYHALMLETLSENPLNHQNILKELTLNRDYYLLNSIRYGLQKAISAYQECYSSRDDLKEWRNQILANILALFDDRENADLDIEKKEISKIKKLRFLNCLGKENLPAEIQKLFTPDICFEQLQPVRPFDEILPAEFEGEAFESDLHESQYPSELKTIIQRTKEIVQKTYNKPLEALDADYLKEVIGNLLFDQNLEEYSYLFEQALMHLLRDQIADESIVQLAEKICQSRLAQLPEKFTEELKFELYQGIPGDEFGRTLEIIPLLYKNNSKNERYRNWYYQSLNSEYSQIRWMSLLNIPFNKENTSTLLQWLIERSEKEKNESCLIKLGDRGIDLLRYPITRCGTITIITNVLARFQHYKDKDGDKKENTLIHALGRIFMGIACWAIYTKDTPQEIVELCRAITRREYGNFGPKDVVFGIKQQILAWLDENGRWELQWDQINDILKIAIENTTPEYIYDTSLFLMHALESNNQGDAKVIGGKAVLPSENVLSVFDNLFPSITILSQNADRSCLSNICNVLLSYVKDRPAHSLKIIKILTSEEILKRESGQKYYDKDGIRQLAIVCIELIQLVAENERDFLHDRMKYLGDQFGIKEVYDYYAGIYQSRLS